VITHDSFYDPTTPKGKKEVALTEAEDRGEVRSDSFFEEPADWEQEDIAEESVEAVMGDDNTPLFYSIPEEKRIREAPWMPPPINSNKPQPQQTFLRQPTASQNANAALRRPSRERKKGLLGRFVSSRSAKPAEHVLVVGAAGELGAEVVRQLVSRKLNTKMVIAGRELAPLKQLASSISRCCDSVNCLQVDCTNEASLRTMFREAQELLGGLDILVHACGWGLCPHMDAITSEPMAPSDPSITPMVSTFMLARPLLEEQKGVFMFLACLDDNKLCPTVATSFFDSFPDPTSPLLAVSLLPPVGDPRLADMELPRSHQLNNSSLSTQKLAASLVEATVKRRRIFIPIEPGKGDNVVGTGAGSPLHQAAADGRKEAVKSLLKKGANVDALDANGHTPLKLALQNNHWDVVRVLLNQGADPALAASLSLFPCRVTCSMKDSRAKMFADITKKLLDHGLSPDKANALGDTHIHVAAQCGAEPVLAAFLKHGVDVNIRDRNGNTPFHAACLTSREGCGRMLVEAGANVDLENAKREKPVDLVSSPSLGLLIADAKRQRAPTVPLKQTPSVVKSVPETSAKPLPLSPASPDPPPRRVVQSEPVPSLPAPPCDLPTPESLYPRGTIEELPLDIKKIISKSEVPESTITSNWAMAINILHFLSGKRQVRITEDYSPRTRNTKISADLNVTTEQLHDLLISKQSPKKFFKIQESSGKGGFGTVSVAKSSIPGDKGRVALKKVNFQDRNRRAVLDEIWFLQTLRHPNIVTYKAAYELGDEVWITMEYMEGGTLQEAVTSSEFSEGQIAYVTKEILKALAYMHSLGYAHRDLKSPNIMMSVEGDVKLIDFGLAIDVNHRPVSMVGSAHWIAPEMILGKRHGCACDLWSVGILLLEMAVGNIPYPRDELKAMLNTGLGMTSASVMLPASHWSPEFRQFATTCLSTNPADRTTAESLLRHPFLNKADTRKSMKNILRNAFYQKNLGGRNHGIFG